MTRPTDLAEGPVSRHVPPMEVTGTLFDIAHTVPKDMVRHPDHRTSIDAARGLLPTLTQLQERVLDAFRVHGPMTDEEVERLPGFADCSPSTVRKRRSELVASGALTCTGQSRNMKGNAMMKVWTIVTPAMEKVG